MLVVLFLKKEAFILDWLYRLLGPRVSAKYGETSRSQWQMQIMQNFKKMEAGLERVSY